MLQNLMFSCLVDLLTLLFYFPKMFRDICKPIFYQNNANIL